MTKPTLNLNNVKKMIMKTSKSELFQVIISILIICLFLFSKYIFKGFTYFFSDIASDSLRVCLPSYYSLYDKIFSGSSLFYSMDMGMGNSFLAHSSIIFDPFTYILFIFGRSNIENMMIVYIILKILAAGIAFYCFLKLFNINRYARLVASIAYSFSGYMIIMGQNYAFMNAVIYLPIIFLSLELFLRKGLLYPYLIIQTLTMLYFYYFFYMIAFAVAAYYLIRYTKYGKIKNKKFIKDTAKILTVSVLAIALSAFFVLPVLAQTFNTVRTENSSTLRLTAFDPQILSTFFARLLHPDILGVWNTYTGEWLYSYQGLWGDYFELVSFSSVLFVLVMPQFFKFSDKKTRRMIIALSLGVAAVLLFPIFGFILNGFKDVTFRFSFILSFLTCLSLALGVNKIIEVKKIDYALLFITIIAVFIAWFLCDANFKYRHDMPLDGMITNFVILIKILIPIAVFIIAAFLIFKYEKLRKPANILFLVIFCFIIEFTCMYGGWLNVRSNNYNNMYANNIGFFDDSYDLIQQVNNDDSSFFRLEKNFDSVVCIIGSNNDSMVQNYYGLKLYSSVNNVNNLRFMQDMGVYCGWPLNNYDGTGIKPRDVEGQQLNYINGVGARYDLMDYLGVKYYIINNDQPVPSYFELLQEHKGLKLYKNNNYFPLAFVKSEYVLYDDFINLENQAKDDLILQYAILFDDADTRCANKVNEVNAMTYELRCDIAREHQEAAEVTMINDNKFKVNLTVAQDGILTFTIPYQDGWTIKVDGVKVDKYKASLGLLAADIQAGQHEIELTYRAEYFNIGLIISSSAAVIVCGWFLYLYRRRVNTKKRHGDLITGLQAE